MCKHFWFFCNRIISLTNFCSLNYGLGGLIYIVNGPEIQYDVPLREYSEIMPMFSQQVLVRGYVATAINCQIIADFHPYQGDFHNPHAVAVTPDASRVYVAELSPYRIWQFVTSEYPPKLCRSKESNPRYFLPFCTKCFPETFSRKFATLQS